MDILSNLSESLKELMSEGGLNQSELAKQLNCGRSKFSDILNAKGAPNYKTFVSIIEYFNCSADFLLGLNEYPCREVTYRRCPEFSAQLRKIFNESHKSQYNFVNATATSWSVLHGWLSGKTFPSADNLIKLAKYFDCSVDFLLGRV